MGLLILTDVYVSHFELDIVFFRFINEIGHDIHDCANLKKKKKNDFSPLSFFLIIKLWLGRWVKNLWAQIDKELA